MVSNKLSKEEIEDVEESFKEFEEDNCKVYETPKELIDDLHKARNKNKKTCKTCKYKTEEGNFYICDGKDGRPNWMIDIKLGDECCVCNFEE